MQYNLNDKLKQEDDDLYILIKTIYLFLYHKSNSHLNNFHFYQFLHKEKLYSLLKEKYGYDDVQEKYFYFLD